MPSSGCQKSALRSEEHTSELQSHSHLVCRLLFEKKICGREIRSYRFRRCRRRSSARCLRGSYPGCDRCFFFNDTATTEIYSFSLHDALPIYSGACNTASTILVGAETGATLGAIWLNSDRKSTRLNSSHTLISYAVFCFK